MPGEKLDYNFGDLGPNTQEEITENLVPKTPDMEKAVAQKIGEDSKRTKALIKKVDDLCNTGQDIPIELLKEPVAHERYVTILREHLQQVMASPKDYHKMNALIEELTRIDKITGKKEQTAQYTKKSDEEKIKLDNDVEQLINQKYSRKQIEEETGENYYVIRESFRRLVTAGRIEPSKVKKPLKK